MYHKVFLLMIGSQMLMGTMQQKRDDYCRAPRTDGIKSTESELHDKIRAVYLDRFTAATCEYQSTTQIALKDYCITTWRCVTCLDGVDLSTLSWRSKRGRWKWQTWKWRTIEMSRHEIDGHENAGLVSGVWIGLRGIDFDLAVIPSNHLLLRF